MAHFAELDQNNTVLRVIVVGNPDCLDEFGNESEAVGVSFCRSLFGEETRWVQASYNNSFRASFAGIGFTYNYELDAFIPPMPQEGGPYVLDTTTFQWIQVSES